MILKNNIYLALKYEKKIKYSLKREKSEKKYNNNS